MLDASTRLLRLCAALIACTLIAACGAQKGRPELDLLYNKSAKYHGVDRNPIVVIPGILGSKLRDEESGVLVWGAFNASGSSPNDPEGLRRIALPIGEADQTLAQLTDQVKPDGVLDKARVSFLGIPLELEIYAGILETLGSGGYRDEALGLAGEIDYGDDHYTCFQFAYDWRRDIVESARHLHAFLEAKRAEVRAEHLKRLGIDKADIKFDIATHSMGGLVTRYFLMYGSQDLPADGSLPELTWEGAKYVERVIFIGTPNAGSTLSLQNLVDGKDFGPFVPIYPAALLGTFPSTYQLLPRSRHNAMVWDGDRSRPVEDNLDPALWERLEWGLASPKEAAIIARMMPDVADPEERRRRALGLQAQILRRAKIFMAALDRPAVPPPGLDLMLVAGDGIATPRTASIDSRTGRLSILDTGEGDGTVLRTSALMDEREDGRWEPKVRSPLRFQSVMFLPTDHVALTRNPIFRDNVLYWLLEEPRGGSAPLADIGRPAP